MAVQGAGLLAMDGQEAGMTPFPGLVHSGPGLGWGIFPLPRGQKRRLGATHHPGLQPALHSGLQL